MAHDLQTERLPFGIGELLAYELVDALPKAGESERQGGVPAVQEPVDRLPLGETCECAVLPEDRSHVGRGPLEPLVSEAQSLVAELQALVEDLPEPVEPLVLGRAGLAGGAGDIHQIDRDDSLVEPAVVLRTAVLIDIGRENRAASHGRIHIAVACGIDLQLLHHLGGQVVGNQPPRGASGGELGQIVVRRALPDVVLVQDVYQLGERGSDEHPGFVLDAFDPLLEDLLYDHGEIGPDVQVLGFVEIHEHRYERGLAVGGHQGDDLVLDGLHPLLYLLSDALLCDLVDDLIGGLETCHGELLADIPPYLLSGDVDEGSEMGKRDGLAAVLAGGDLGYDLSGDVACGGEAVRSLDLGPGDHGAVLEHILEIDEIAVVLLHGEIVRVMEMDYAFVVRLDDIWRQEYPPGEILADLSGNIVPLDGHDLGVLVGVLLLHLLVVAFYEAEYPGIGGVGLTGQVPRVTISDVALGGLRSVLLDYVRLHQLLDLLHGKGAAEGLAVVLDDERDVVDLTSCELGLPVAGLVGLDDGLDDLLTVELHFRSVPLYDLHALGVS